MPNRQNESKFPHANEPGGLARDAAELIAEVKDWQKTNLGRAELQDALPKVILELEATRSPDASYKAKLRAYCYQELARSHYKDDYANPFQAHRDALIELEKAGLRDPELTDQRTLCAGGAVHKYLFQHEARAVDLERAEGYYRAAHELQCKGEVKRTDSELGLENCGYPGINAAYMLDLRAAQLSRNSLNRAQRADAEQLRKNADALRRRVLEMLQQEAKPATQWDCAVYGEAYFGLGDFPAAATWLQRFMEHQPADWERQTCARQLIHLAHHRGVSLERDSPALAVLLQLFGSPEPARAADLARCTLRGKVGLALSGGGHRAALYHIGVLARLADVGALRDVETISTVSGGSIVGVLYYLKVKKLLEEHADHEITHQHYRDIVHELRADYIRGVQQNLRLQSVASLWNNMLMLFGNKSHSERLGELYTQYFFGGSPRTMHSLLITPPDARGNPRDYNWRRTAKVPVLMINATCLNTGHTWHFTATWMGEPPQLRGFEIDKNERLRRAYYEEELQARKTRGEKAPDVGLGWPAPALGTAVAASAGVPGLFPPMPIHGMYEGRVVRLVDGGCHDNQGVQALLVEGCKRLLCSDASGQMHEQADPGDGRLSVLLRTSTILMDRVREAQLKDVVWRVHSDVLHLLFVHLRQDLSVREIPWLTSHERMPAGMHGRTDYGIDRGTQRRLANLRTDLDAFTDLEADALMCSGYLATRQRLIELDHTHRMNGHSDRYGGYDIDAQDHGPFLALRDVLALPTEPQARASLTPIEQRQVQTLNQQLDIGADTFGKMWRLSALLRSTVWSVAALLLATATYWIYVHWDVEIALSQHVGAAVLALATFALFLVAPAARYALTPESALRRWLTRIAVATLGGAAAKLYLWLLEPQFLRFGARDHGAKLLFQTTPRESHPPDSTPPDSPVSSVTPRRPGAGDSDKHVP